MSETERYGRTERELRDERVIPPEDVEGVRTRTGRLLSEEQDEVGLDGHQRLEAALDALEAYRRTRLVHNESRAQPDGDFYAGLKVHIDEVNSAVSDAKKFGREQMKEREASAPPQEEPVTGGKREVGAQSGSGGSGGSSQSK
jgi:DNA-directed RNA polymerase specialized sigma24 family protein